MDPFDFIKDINQNIITVLGTPRSGSTALCSVIEKRTGYFNYMEIFQPWPTAKLVNLQANPKIIKLNEVGKPLTKKIDNFWLNFHRDKKLIIKIFTFQLENITTEQFDKILNKSFVIYLERRDIVSQIISYHIAKKTQKFRYHKNETQPSNFYVDETDLVHSVRSRLQLQQQAEIRFKKLAHVSLVYEDIIDYLEEADTQKQNRPANYDSLKLKVEQLLNELQAK